MSARRWIGLWRWRAASGWQQLTVGDAQDLAVTADGAVFGDFGASGIWRWARIPGWSQLTSLDAQQLAVSKVTGDLFADFGTIGKVELRFT